MSWCVNQSTAFLKGNNWDGGNDLPLKRRNCFASLGAILTVKGKMGTLRSRSLAGQDLPNCPKCWSKKHPAVRRGSQRFSGDDYICIAGLALLLYEGTVGSLL